MSNRPSSSGIDQEMHTGWLWKHGGRVRNWKKRFFVLTTAGRLTYYNSDTDAEHNTHPLGIIDVHKALYVTRRVKDEEPGAWPEPVPPDVCFTIITNDRNYGVYSEDEKETAAWVQQLQTVRGGKDTSDITVEQVQDVQPQRRSSMSSHMNNFCMRYKMLELSPKVQMMWMKWNNVGQRALKAMADHFGIVEEITLMCDAGDMYKRLPTNRRTRIGEYVFADYMDELRFNLCAEFGDEEVAKAAFRSAFTKRKIRVEMLDGDALSPNSVQLVDGVLVLQLQTSRFGAGIHLAGRGLSRDVAIGDLEATLSGSSVAGMSVSEVVDIARHVVAVTTACSELQAKLPGNPSVEFRCDYREIAAKVKAYDGGVACQLGSVVLQPIVCRLLGDLAAFVGRASAEAAERIAGETGTLGLVFRLGAPDGNGCDPWLDVNADGEVVITSSEKKLVEMAMYARPPVFNLDKLFA